MSKEIDLLLAMDLESFTKYYFTKLTPQEQLALSGASQAIMGVVEKGNPHGQDGILSLFGHRHHNRSRKGNSQLIGVQPEVKGRIHACKQVAAPEGNHDADGL